MTRLALALLLLIAPAFADERPARPDVLFIVFDDLNDWIKPLDDSAPIAMPQLARLASWGTLFTRAYCASPACNPSRVATLTGLRPTSTGVYGNRSDWRHALPTRPTIMQRFRSAGYDVRGAGKIFHHHLGGAFHDDASFDDFQPMRPQRYPASKLNAAPEYGSKNTDWGAFPSATEETIDFATAEYCVNVLRQREQAEDDARPLFLACGLFKPHSPFFAPAPYHEPFRNITPPPKFDDDWNDLPAGAASLMQRTRWFWRGMTNLTERQPNAFREFVRSYAACASLADEQLGRVLDALERSGRRERTVIVCWSDHGFHLGEKNHIEKFSLWETATRVPLVVVAPGVTTPNTTCTRPVDLTSLYPTLLDLCGLTADATCDGVTLTPLLRTPTAGWNHPALMTYGRGNHAVRSEHWRYIRYADDSEELYNHVDAPREWTNLAGDSKYDAIKAEHRGWLPQQEAERVRDLKRE